MRERRNNNLKKNLRVEIVKYPYLTLPKSCDQMHENKKNNEWVDELKLY